MDLYNLVGRKEDELNKKELSCWNDLQKLNAKKSQLEEDKAKLLYKFQLKAIDESEFNERKSLIEKEIEKNKKAFDFKLSCIKEGSFQEEELEEEIDEKKLKLYKALLDKYSSIINEAENKTIPQIKSLITSNDMTIQSICEKFKPESYEFELNYLDVAEKIYDFISKEFSCIELDLKLNYWLSPKEFFDLKIGDAQDFAIFYCSCLAALGDVEAKVLIVEMENAKVHALVQTTYNGKSFIFDLTQEKAFDFFSGIEKYSLNGIKIKQKLYCFNNDFYEQEQ